MPWSNDKIDAATGRRICGQKSIAHKYKGLARLEDQEYRGILIAAAGPRRDGSRSAADKDLTQRAFDVFMAMVEYRLERNIQEGVCQEPRSINLRYWRNRLPASGMSNSREHHEIRDWWYKLQPYIEPAKRNPDYLHAIAAHACGLGHVDSITHLTSLQAGLTIEAVKDRLRWALRKGTPEQAVGDPPVDADAPAVPAAACPILPSLDITDDADQQIEIPTAADGDSRRPVPVVVSSGTGAGSDLGTLEDVPF